MESEEGIKLAEFVEEHQNEIIGLYRDSNYKWGGWNGIVISLGEIQERYEFDYDPDELIAGEFEQIIRSICP